MLAALDAGVRKFLSESGSPEFCREAFAGFDRRRDLLKRSTSLCHSFGRVGMNLDGHRQYPPIDSRSDALFRRYDRSESPSHIPAVFSADLEQGLGDLAEGADAHGVHQYGEDVVVPAHGLAQALQHGRRRGFMGLVEIR